jgi:hypothetical protein
MAICTLSKGGWNTELEITKMEKPPTTRSLLLAVIKSPAQSTDPDEELGLQSSKTKDGNAALIRSYFSSREMTSLVGLN